MVAEDAGATRRTLLGLLCAAMLPLPGRAGPARPSPLGLAVGFNRYRWMDPDLLSDEFADYARLGVRRLRTDLYWSFVQAAGPSSFEWSGFDRVVDLAVLHGIEVLPVCGITPDWARSDPATASPPADPAAYAAFIHRAVRRYAPRGLRAWELWNEPNLAGPWPPMPDPVAYAATAAAGAAAVRDADRAASVILGGLAAVQTTGPLWRMKHYAAVDFLSVVYDEIGPDSFDAVGFHPYSYPEMPSETDPRNGWGLMAGPIRDVMRRHGDAGKPIWITEYGAPTNLPAVTGNVQAGMLRDALRFAARTEWLGPMYWYSYRDLGADVDDIEDWFGLRDADGAEKPAYRAFREIGVDANSVE